MDVKKYYLVEIIRYGKDKLGVYPYGIFDNFDEIESKMKKYCDWRGGKYPAYYVTEVVLNPTLDDETFFDRKRFRVKGYHEVDCTLYNSEIRECNCEKVPVHRGIK